MLPSLSSQAGKHEKARTIADAGIVSGRHKVTSCMEGGGIMQADRAS